MTLDEEAHALAGRLQAKSMEECAAKEQEAAKTEYANAIMFKKEKTKAQRCAAPVPSRPQPAIVSIVAGKPPDAPVLVLPPPEEYKRKPKIYDIKSAGADVGITYSPHANGLLVTGFVKDSLAAASDLIKDDVIIQVQDEFLAGLSALEGFYLMSGDMNSRVDVTVSRQVKGHKTRIVIYDVVRDVPAPPKKADVGFSFKQQAAGVKVVKVFAGTSAFDELQTDDLITEIDDEFIAGLPVADVRELLAGPARSTVQLGFSRVDASKKIKERCFTEVLFDHNARPVDLQEYSSLGDVGIEFTGDPLGLKITGFKKDSSAAFSDLQIGDVVTQVEDELIVGLPPFLAFDKMSGCRDTEVELSITRKTADGSKTRLSAVVLRDIGACPKVARPGFEVVFENSGLRVAKIITDSAVEIEAELELGDVITAINDEFITGLTMHEVWPLLWGQVGSVIELSATRLEEGIKSRVSASVSRDHGLAQHVPKPPTLPFMAIPSLSSKKPAAVKSSAKKEDNRSDSLSSRKKTDAKRGVGSIVVASMLVLLLAYLAHMWLMRSKKMSLLEFSEMQCKEALPVVRGVMHKAGEKWNEAKPILNATMYKVGDTMHRNWQEAKPVISAKMRQADESVRTFWKEAKPVLQKAMEKGTVKIEEAYKVLLLCYRLLTCISLARSLARFFFSWV